ncbi:MAG TPA: branched-chain amino acid ABC transporter substrate-binding protein [Candidatus Dormibacteraeota bacterium]|nr:branched-chain amino acid ABC transporter substrate-binding protein [Candidatus Dormibacteraeota bacterium]
MVRARGLAVLISATFVAFACGGSSGGTGSKGEIDIASSLPVSGADASSGLPTQQGAQFAVTRAATVRGYTLKFVPYDDAVNGVHDAQKGVQNVQAILSNSKILGMVGPFNSGVAKAEIPVANQAPLALISPSNTNECLTQALDYCQAANGFTPSSLRPSGKNNYFRVAAADTFQGPAMADFAIKAGPPPAGLGITKVAVWDDEETFGQGVAANFAKEFKAKGGTVVDTKHYDPKAKKDFKDFLASAKSAGAQGIYVGATTATGGCIARGQMAGVFSPDIFYMGPDGIGDSQCLKDSGAMATSNMFATQGVADATQNPDAKAIVDAYTAAYPGSSSIGAYTFAGYDCAALIIDAIGRAIDANNGNMPSRQQVIDALAKTSNFKGLTGVITFDPNGDPTHPTLQLQQVKSGAWAFVAQFSQGG